MIEDLVVRLQACPERRPHLIREYAEQTGQPVARVYRHLREAGHGSGRRRRSDAGRTRAPEADLETLASLLLAALRQSGQATLHLPVARQIMRAEGMTLGDLSDAQLARLLRERGIDLGTQRRGRQTHGEIRSRPNELHLVDPSRALVWYLPGSRRPQRALATTHEPYKNKPIDEGAQRKLGLWRYVLTDHASGCLRVRYYQVAGENPGTLWDFLCHCWSAGAWHGVPEWLWWDKGSQHTAIGAALAALGVQARAHAPGNSRAKGSVERAQHLVEQHFESRLALQPMRSIEELNERVEVWAAHYNANTIPELDTRLRRGGTRAVRLELWQRIGPELREFPADAADLPRWQPVQRKVAANLTISFRHPRRRSQTRYRVAQVPGLRVGQQVTVQPLLDDAGAVLVRSSYGGEDYEARLLPREVDEYGFPADAPRPGEFRPPTRTEVERAGERLRELAGPRRPGEASHGGQFAALDAVAPAGGGKVIPLPRRGREIELQPAPAAAPLSLHDAGLRVRDRLGAAWDPELFDEIARRWPRGAPARELDAWAAEQSAGAEAAG